MAARTTTEPGPGSDRIQVGTAWLITLAASDLPDILWAALTHAVPPWLVWAKPVALAALITACLMVGRVRPLWQYGVVLLVLETALLGSSAVGRWSVWQRQFAVAGTSFTHGYIGLYLRDIGVAGAVVIALLILKRRRSACFLVGGQPGAPISPIRWLGIGPGGTWRVFAWIFGLAAALAVLIPTVLALRPSLAELQRAAPLLGPCLLFSAVNALNEEIYFRAAPLATLEGVVGRSHALLLNVVFFGLAHVLYGSPSGLVGFAMTGFLAYLMARSMLETRGLTCPWLMHLLPDMVVFVSYAILWVRR